MTGINHALAGVAVASLVKQPLLAVPLAFASHFFLDTMPHFGFTGNRLKTRTKEQLFWTVIISDAFLLLALMTLLLFKQEFIFLLCALTAFSPDFVWIYGYFKGKTPTQMAKQNSFSKFHKAIQQLERVYFLPLEIIYLLFFGAIALSAIY